MKQIHKDYYGPFLLEPTKLTRLLDRIHERLGEQKPTQILDHFEVFLSGNRREEMETLDEVLAVENSRRHRIERLLLISSAATDGAIRPEYEVQVDFGVLKTVQNSNNKSRVIAVSVSSDHSGWASQTLSEVEEQVERTQMRYTPPMVALVTILVTLLFAAMFQIARTDQSADISKTMWLRSADVERLDKILSQNRPVTDEEMREITTMQLRNLVAERRTPPPPPPGRTKQLVFLGVPIVLVLGCVVVLLGTCYPGAVFLWGDEVQRYADLLNRRKAAWGIIVSVIVVGLLSKMLYEGIVMLTPNN